MWSWYVNDLFGRADTLRYLQGLRHNDIDDLLPNALQEAFLDLLHCDVLDTLQDEVASVRNKPLLRMVPTQRTPAVHVYLPAAN